MDKDRTTPESKEVPAEDSSGSAKARETQSRSEAFQIGTIHTIQGHSEKRKRAALAKGADGFGARSIATFDSLLVATAENNDLEIARLYFYYVLDHLVDLAHEVSLDFFHRPHLYIDADGIETATRVGHLRSGYGRELVIPDKEQRTATYWAVFGHGVGYDAAASDFGALRNNLLEACSAFAERVYDTGEDMLRASVLTAHRSLKVYLKGLHGDSVKLVTSVLPVLTEELCYKVYRTHGISAVFGIRPPPSSDWPYTQSAQGDKLVEAIGGYFGYNPEKPLTFEQSNNLQRIATRGAEALAVILQFDESQGTPDEVKGKMNILITKCYTWAAALNSISPQIPMLSSQGNRALIPQLRSG
jgi:hypothetical protein